MDSVWWSVWWPWMLIWAVTAVALIGSGWIACSRWRELRGRGQPIRGITFYLHDESVMDLYQAQGGKYKPALKQEVQEEISSSKEAKLSAEIQGVGGGAGKTVDHRVFRKYIEIAEPITVIRIIMEVLEKADAIVYLDLVNGAVESGRGLKEALRTTTLKDPAYFTVGELGQLESYVSIRGVFRMAEENGDRVVFEAICEEPKMTAVFRCARSGIRGRQIPDEEFQARLLGKIQARERATGRLIVNPIAIFQ